jgi:hypothetical protein
MPDPILIDENETHQHFRIRYLIYNSYHKLRIAGRKFSWGFDTGRNRKGYSKLDIWLVALPPRAINVRKGKSIS